jgi:hypothetical protein
MSKMTSWTQINDASILDVTGDVRTFGTVYVSTNGRGIIWGTSANQEVRGIT